VSQQALYVSAQGGLRVIRKRRNARHIIVSCLALLLCGLSAQTFSKGTLYFSVAADSGVDQTPAQGAVDLRNQDRAKQEQAERDATAAANEKQRLVAEADVARNQAALAKAAQDQKVFEQELERYRQAKAENDAAVAEAKAARASYDRLQAEYNRKLGKSVPAPSLAAKPNEANAPEKASDKSDRMICKRFLATGSLVRSYRTCKTNREWQRERETIRSVTNNSGSCASQGLTGGC
jgi:hypothetical protein